MPQTKSDINSTLSANSIAQKFKADDISFKYVNLALAKLTQDLKNYLFSWKETCTSFENEKLTQSIAEQHISKWLSSFSEKLDVYFEQVWTIVSTLDKDQYAINQKYFQSELTELFYVTPYTKRVYDKPLGYPGDYMLMLQIYNNSLEGDGLYGKLIHKYSMEVPTAIANRNRIKYYGDKIIAAVNKKTNSRIASIACGPAKEMEYALSNCNLSNIEAISLLDLEPKALEHAKNTLSNKTPDNFKKNISYYEINIMDLIRGKNSDIPINKEDLIYSAGLIDYFNDKLALKIMKFLYGSLNSGGQLIIGNVSNKDKHRAYSEFLGDWKLHLRSENDLLKLSDAIETPHITKIEVESETNMNIFLIIEKP